MLRAVLSALLLGSALAVAASAAPAAAGLDDGFEQIDVGYHHTCGITTVDELYCWGTGGSGRIGNGLNGPTSQVAPLLVPPPSGQVWASVSTGFSHTCALTASGAAYCFGSDLYGEIGDGPAVADPELPVVSAVAAPGGVSWAQIAAGAEHTCAVTTAGAAYCWGRDDRGQLGNGATTGNQTSPSLVSTPGGVTWASIAVGGPDLNNNGGKQTCAVSTAGAGYCWGDDGSGQLGNGATTGDQVSPVAVSTPGGVSWAAIRVGLKHACGVSTTGAGYCWGLNAARQLGLGGSAPGTVTVPTAVVGGITWAEIQPGSSHSCGRSTTGVSYCWGTAGGAGELGTGTPDVDQRVDPAPIVVPSGVTGWTAVTGGYQHNCAIAATTGDAWCWGNDAFGKLGNGPAVTGNQLTPTLVTDGGVVVTPPSAPATISATPGDGQVTLNWSAPPSDGGSQITGYVVTPSIGAVPQAPITFPSIAISQIITGLTNGATYTFKVAAINEAGTGAQSPASAPVTPTSAEVVPGAPTGVTGTPGNGSVQLSWNAPASTGTQPIDGYVVTPSVGGVNQTPVTFDSTATTQTIPGLTNGFGYRFRVAARSAAGVGANSTLSPTYTPRSEPSQPTGVSAVAGNGQATVSWTAPVSNGGAAITGYAVVPYIGAAAQSPVGFASTATTQVVTGLTNGTTYTFRVRAQNAAGFGSSSDPSAPVTPQGPITVPGTPTGVTGTAGDGQVSLSWSAPASNGGSAITGYVVTPSIDGVAQAPVTFSSVLTNQVVTGLANGTAYTFRVAAKNAAGTGAASAPSDAITPVGPASPFAPFTSWGAFVDRQFLDLTAVAPTSAQRTTWIAQLTSGAASKGDLIEALRRGSDNTVAVDPAARLYRAFLQRTPDAGGLRFWVNRRRTGSWTLVRIADYFAGSSEFTRKYGTLTNRQFVTRIYTDVLERTADPAGVDFWTRQLDLRRRNRGAVMVGFSESSEYQRKQAERTDAAVAYIYLLGRAPSSAEVVAWVDRQVAGTTQAALAQELLESPAYAARIGG
jgi:alpha-tubulin suppressor-like RCC1 family protein